MPNKSLFQVTMNQASMDKVVALVKQFPTELRRRVLEKAVFNAALMVLRTAQDNVRKHNLSGDLYKSLARKKITTFSETGAFIYARRTKQFKGGFHAHLLEYGHRMVVKKKKGMFSGLYQTGHVQAFPFIRPALADNDSKVLDHIAKVTAKALKRYKLGRSMS